MTKRDDDLRDVLREERSRGRKQQVDIDAERLQRERKDQIEKIRMEGTEDQLRALLRSWGISETKIEAAVSVFRSVREL
jgi:hypothetical protein